MSGWNKMLTIAGIGCLVTVGVDVGLKHVTGGNHPFLTVLLTIGIMASVSLFVIYYPRK